MKIALISDIHGNLVALETALAAIEDEAPDQIICLGDVAATGPQPREALERVQALGCRVVMGNTDAALLGEQKHAVADDDMARRVDAIDAWCAAQLTPANREFLPSFQPRMEVDLDAKTKLLCYHGAPGSNTAEILATTPEAELDALLGDYRAAIMAGGHTHIAMLRRHRAMLLLNPGSVGLPYEQTEAGHYYNPSWAEYAVVELVGGQLSVGLRRAPFDVGRLIDAARASDMPHADWWVKDWR